MPILPDTQWKKITILPTDPHSEPGARTPESLDAVLDALDVEATPRYQPDRATYCNIAVHDFLRMMGSPLPEKYHDMFLSANVIGLYLGKEEAKAEGWHLGTLQEARDAAAKGHPAIGVWVNTHGHGHVVAVRPDGTFWNAGRKNYARARLEQCFGPDKLAKIGWAWRD